MRILCDRHHMGLTDSLLLLFQKRLGWEIFFQKGMEWYPEFWNLQPFESTAVQYLERELEGLPGITLEEFKNTKFDVLLCSVPQHIEPFKKLIALYQPEAKLIFQIGNAWSIPNNVVKNVMASARCLPPIQINYIEYHQEFDLDIFHYEPISRSQQNGKIYSFINCLGVVDLYKKDWELFLELERLMPDWEFKSFGGQCRDGAIWDRQELADKMREATFIFQCKTEGDGYGHNIHAAAAVGRPLIVRKSDYKGKLAEPLIAENTSIIVDNKTPEQISEEIEAVDQADIGNLSFNINAAFKENINFDAEELEIRDFLDRLR